MPYVWIAWGQDKPYRAARGKFDLPPSYQYSESANNRLPANGVLGDFQLVVHQGLFYNNREYLAVYINLTLSQKNKIEGWGLESDVPAEAMNM